MRRAGLFALLLAVVGCDKPKDQDSKQAEEARSEQATAKKEKTPPDLASACKKLADAVKGSNCQKGSPAGIGAAAWERYDFDLVEPKGEKCQVLSFRKVEDLDATVKAFDGAAALAGPHRYANRDALLFVQCNEGMPRDLAGPLTAALEKL